MDPFNEPLNEIVFEKRNKSYGAYVLRKEYTDSLKFGILITYAVAATIAVLGVLISNKEIIPPKLEIENFIEEIFIDKTPIDLPKKPELPEPPKEKKHVIIPPENELPKEASDELQERKEIPTLPVEPKEPTFPTTNGAGDPGTETNGQGLATDPAESDKVVLVADVAPEMEGGVMKYLQKNLRYPEIAVEKKTSGTVLLSFVVEKDGSVNNINVLRSVGDGCEEEALRVVKKMKWKPGKAGGHPVRVQFTLPVKFVINP